MGGCVKILGGVTDSARTNEREERGNDFNFQNEQNSAIAMILIIIIVTNDSDWLN